MRQGAKEALGELDPATLAEHTPALIAQLQTCDENVHVCSAALAVLRRLEPAALAVYYSEQLRGLLNDSSESVMRAAAEVLCRLESEAPALLSHDDAQVRIIAMTTLNSLEAEALAKHAAAMVASLRDQHVRAFAISALGTLHPDQLIPMC